MKLMQIVFSPTGGTQKVADVLAAAMGMPAEKVDLCCPELPETAIGKEDAALIALPSYGGRVPALAAQRCHIYSHEFPEGHVLYGSEAYSCPNSILLLRSAG